MGMISLTNHYLWWGRIEVVIIYPEVWKDPPLSNGKTHCKYGKQNMAMGLNGKILYQGGMFTCHVWLPEGKYGKIHHVSWEKSLWILPCSVIMSNYRRSPSVIELSWLIHRDSHIMDDEIPNIASKSGDGMGLQWCGCMQRGFVPKGGLV